MASLPCRFSLIRYVPDVIRGEFVNIGVIVFSDLAEGSDAIETPLVQFTRDWRRVRCLDRHADINLLEALEQEIAANLRSKPNRSDPQNIVGILEGMLSNTIQISEPSGTLADNLAGALESLMEMYVTSPKALGPRTQCTKTVLSRMMRTQFIGVGVWSKMQQRVAAALYTHPGDPLTIDCSYAFFQQPSYGGMRRMFQAIPLGGDLESAQVFALAAHSLRDGVSRLENVKLDLTAIVDSRPCDDAPKILKERYNFAIETMSRQSIRVVAVSSIREIAALAQGELNTTI